MLEIVKGLVEKVLGISLPAWLVLIILVLFGAKWYSLSNEISDQNNQIQVLTKSNSDKDQKIGVLNGSVATLSASLDHQNQAVLNLQKAGEANQKDFETRLAVANKTYSDHIAQLQKSYNDAAHMNFDNTCEASMSWLKDRPSYVPYWQ